MCFIWPTKPWNKSIFSSKISLSLTTTIVPQTADRSKNVYLCFEYSLYLAWIRSKGTFTRNVCVCIFVWSLPFHSWKCKHKCEHHHLLLKNILDVSRKCNHGRYVWIRLNMFVSVLNVFFPRSHMKVTVKKGWLVCWFVILLVSVMRHTPLANTTRRTFCYSPPCHLPALSAGPGCGVSHVTFGTPCCSYLYGDDSKLAALPPSLPVIQVQWG